MWDVETRQQPFGQEERGPQHVTGEVLGHGEEYLEVLEIFCISGASKPGKCKGFDDGRGSEHHGTKSKKQKNRKIGIQ